jgi:hypothetical protein
VYQGTVPVDPAPAQFDVEQEELLTDVYDLLKGEPEEKEFKFAFLMAKEAIGPTGKKSRLVDAMLSLRPDWNRKYAGEVASRLNRQIREDLGDRGNAAIRGISFRRIVNTLDGGHGAMFVKEFITRDGSIVQGPARPDWNMRLRAAELSMRLLGIGKEKESGSGAVTIQVISYLGGPVAEQRPWPGGGRVQDGRMQPTVGPDSPAALAARAALPPSRVTVDLGGPKTERDD